MESSIGPFDSHGPWADDPSNPVGDSTSTVLSTIAASTQPTCAWDHYGEALSTLQRVMSDSEWSEHSRMSDILELDEFLQQLQRTSHHALTTFLQTFVRSVSPTHITPVLSNIIGGLNADTARIVVDSVREMIEHSTYIALCAVIAHTPHDTTPFERSHEPLLSPVIKTVVQSIPPHELLEIIPTIVQNEPETVVPPVIHAVITVLPSHVTPILIEKVVQSIPPHELLEIIPTIVQDEPEMVVPPVVHAALEVLPSHVTPMLIEKVVQSIPPHALRTILPDIVHPIARDALLDEA